MEYYKRLIIFGSELKVKNMKDNYFQVIRAICIMAVILIHLKAGTSETGTLDYWIVFRRIINFPVAVFFFLSGYFVNKNKVKEDSLTFIMTRSLRLLIPLFIWGFVYNFFSSKDLIFNLTFVARSILGLTAAHLYFIVVLIQLVILTPLLIKLVDLNNKCINIFLLSITPLFLIILYIANIVYGINIPYYTTFFVGWFIYYYLGILLRKLNLDFDKIKTSKLLVLSLISLAISIGEAFLLKDKAIFLSTTQLSFSNIIYSISLIFLILKVHKTNAINSTNILVLIGNYSFGIYFIHLAIMKVVNTYIFDFSNLPEFIAYQTITFILVLIISSILVVTGARLLGKKYSKYLGLC